MIMTTLSGATGADVASGVGVLRVGGAVAVVVPVPVVPVPQAASTAEMASTASAVSARSAAGRRGAPVEVATIAAGRSSMPVFTGLPFSAPVAPTTMLSIAAGAPRLRVDA